MLKLSEYVELAATGYFQETGDIELDSVWIAEFFQDGGIADDFPRQDLIAFANLVQKTLIKKSDYADKQARSQISKIIKASRPGN